MLDEGRVKAFEDVGVGFESEREELLQFPKALLGGLIFKLLRHAIEGPLQIGRRKVDASSIDVGVIAMETISLRADYAAIDDEAAKVFVSWIRVPAQWGRR